MSLSETLSQLSKTLDKERVEYACIFGSAVEWDDPSDIDVLVISDQFCQTPLSKRPGLINLPKEINGLVVDPWLYTSEEFESIYADDTIMDEIKENSMDIIGESV